MRLLCSYLFLSTGFWLLGRCASNYSTSGPLSINADQISLDLRQAWCTSEIQVCGQICTANVNSCNSNTLTYKCTCSSGIQPNISSYQNTLPYFICQQWITNCVDGHPNDLVGQDGCLSVVCGSKNASNANLASSSLPNPFSVSSSQSTRSASTSLGRTLTTPTTNRSPSPPETSTRSTSTNTAPPSHALEHSSSPEAGQSSGLSTGEKAGIGAGAAAGGLIVFAILLFVLLQRRKRKARERIQSTSGAATKPPSPWPSLKRFFNTELSGQYDRPELEGSAELRHEADSGIRPPMTESSAGSRPPTMSAVAHGPVDPHDFRGDAHRWRTE